MKKKIIFGFLIAIVVLCLAACDYEVMVKRHGDVGHEKKYSTLIDDNTWSYLNSDDKIDGDIRTVTIRFERKKK